MKNSENWVTRASWYSSGKAKIGIAGTAQSGRKPEELLFGTHVSFELMQMHKKSTTYRLSIHTEVPVAVISVPMVFFFCALLLHFIITSSPAISSWPCITFSPESTVNNSYTKSESNNTTELHLSGLMRMTSHPDMQKIRIIGFFFENRLH